MDVILDPQNIKLLLVGQFPDGETGGLALTLILGVLSILFATVLGVGFGLVRAARIKMVSLLFALVIEVTRALPLVLVLFVVWFALPEFGVMLDLRVTTVVAISFNGSAYVAEVVRGSLRAVPHGQSEAGYAAGLGYLGVMRHVVLPQAARVAMPALTGRYVVIMKGTALAYLLGVADVTGMGRLISTRELAPVQVYLALLILYWVVNRALTLLMVYLEARMWRERKGSVAATYYAE